MVDHREPPGRDSHIWGLRCASSPATRRSVEFIPRESRCAPKLHSRRINSTLRFHLRPSFAPLRATSSNQIAPVQLATSVDPPRVLRNKLALGREMSNVKMKRVQGSKLFPRSLLPKSYFLLTNSARPRRATPSYQTCRIPKYFPNSFETGQNSRFFLNLRS